MFIKNNFIYIFLWGNIGTGEHRYRGTSVPGNIDTGEHRADPLAR